MKTQEISQLTVPELQSKLLDLRQELYVWQEKIMTGTESNYGKLKRVRRDIARVQTMLSQKESEKAAS